MTHALNLTLPIKQDAETLAKLQHLKAVFADEVQSKIAAALKQSRIVHFARVVVIDDKYIQVITEYEGSHQEYTEFFRRALTPVFAAIFSLADTKGSTSTILPRSSNSRRTPTRSRWARPPTVQQTSMVTRPAGCSRLTTT